MLCECCTTCASASVVCCVQCAVCFVLVLCAVCCVLCASAVCCASRSYVRFQVEELKGMFERMKLARGYQLTAREVTVSIQVPRQLTPGVVGG